MAVLAVLFSLLAELLMFRLICPVGLPEVLQTDNLIAMLTRMMRAVTPPTQMSRDLEVRVVSFYGWKAGGCEIHCNIASMKLGVI